MRPNATAQLLLVLKKSIFSHGNFLGDRGMRGDDDDDNSSCGSASVCMGDLEETLRLILDKLLQLVDLPFLENTIEYLANGENNSVENYQHLFTFSRLVD